MDVVTVGLYLMVGERFVFVFGPSPEGDRLAVVRVGGHREGDESPWACAQREAREEIGLEAAPVSAAETLCYTIAGGFSAFCWDLAGPRPLLVIPRDRGPQVNVMFLARAEGVPAPCSEVKGLLLLTPAEVAALCQRPTTLREFLAGGGQALMRGEYPLDLVLAPASQCRLLADLFGNSAAGPLLG